MTGHTNPLRLGPTLKGLRELSGDRVRLLPLMVAVSVLAFLFEGLAIYLILPLVEALGATEAIGTQSGLSGWITETVGALPAEQRLGYVVAAIVVCILLKSAVAYLGTAFFAHVTQRVGHDIRRNCFAQMLSASPLFHGSRPAGAMINSLTGQTWAVSEGLQNVAMLLMHASAVCVFFVLLVALSWKATLVTIAGVLIAAGVAAGINQVATRLGRKAVSTNERLSIRMLEGLSGHRTLRMFNGEDKAQQSFDAASDDSRRSMLGLQLTMASPQFALEVLFAALIGGALLLLQGVSVGQLLVLIALLFRMQPHVIALVHARATLAKLRGAVENLTELRDQAVLSAEPKGLPVAPPLRQALVFEDVSFSYMPDEEHKPDQRAALHHASFEIPGGVCTALVGHSGAGKSTIATLLCRLADPDRGVILLDGKDITAFDAASWRERCAMVPQDVFLFNDSVSANISLGRPDARAEEIARAARLADAHEFICALPQGYDTLVGDRGANISGGQRQRIALARALLRDPEFLILDEATNALDPRSERLVADALDAGTRFRTTLLIAHRLSTVRRADHVILLDHGRVVETGTPADLERSGGAFTQLFAQERLGA